MLKSALSSLCLVSLVSLSFSCHRNHQDSFGPLEYTASLETAGNLVRVPVSLNGASPELFILDTGLVGMMISEEYAVRSNARKTGETVTVTGSGGQASSKMEVVKNLLMDLEGLQWPVAQARVAAPSVTDPIRDITGYPFHGMVGSFLFESYVVKIDFQSERLTLYAPRTFNYSGDGIILPLVFRNRKPHVALEIQVQPQSTPKQVTVLLDLGSSRSLDLRGDNLTPFSDLPKRHLLGFGGESLHPTGRIHRLSIGSYSMENVVTTFESSRSSSQKVSGRIGNQLLSQFNVILNYPEKQVILEPISSLDPPQVDMSGLRLKKDFKTSSVVVDFVYPDSPAQEVGIKPGDRLLEINGQALEPLSLPDIRQQFIDQNQSERQILVQRGQTQLSFSMTLRPLI